MQIITAIVLAALLGACGRDGADTVPLAMHTAEHLPVRVLWSSDALENPKGRMGELNGDLLVPDVRELYLVAPSGQARPLNARSGEGPGEYRSRTAMGAYHDSIVVHDERLQRFSILSSTGEFARSVVRVSPWPWVSSTIDENYVFGDNVILGYRNGVLYTVAEAVGVEKPVRTALLWSSLTDDSTHVIASWPDRQYAKTPPGTRYMLQEQWYGPRAYIAIGKNGRIAYGDGQTYCIKLASIDSALTLRQDGEVCRQWDRQKPGRDIYTPNLSLVENSEQREHVRQAWAPVRVPEQLPSFDALLLDDAGRIWTRNVGSEMINVHPGIARVVPGTGPKVRTWSVMSKDDGLRCEVELPSLFKPRVISQDVYGYLLNPMTGEVAVAAAPLPACLRDE